MTEHMKKGLDPQAECDTIADHLRLSTTIPINDYVQLAHRNSVCKGWPDSDAIVRLALVHAEVSEAVEEIRDGRPLNQIYMNGEKPEGVPSELADIVIRVFDFCGRYDIDLEAAIKQKMAYNTTRPMRHGGKIV